MDKVYLVLFVYYDDFKVLGVYKNRNDALDYYNKLPQEYEDDSGSYIEKDFVRIEDHYIK